MERALFLSPQQGAAGYDPLGTYSRLKQIDLYMLSLFSGAKPLGGRLREYQKDRDAAEAIRQRIRTVELPVTPSPEIELFGWRGVGEYIITRSPNEPAIHVASPDLATGVRLAREADLLFAAETGNSTLWDCWYEAHSLLAKYGIFDFNTKISDVATGYDSSARETAVRRAGEVASAGQRSRSPAQSEESDESDGDGDND